MKIFLGGKNKRLDKKTAQACVGINLLATPGLGTIMAGRFVAGTIQLIASVAGFVLLMKWMFSWFWSRLSSTVGAPAPAWQWQAGAALFALGWIGSLWSSVDMVRNASTETPPKLDGSPG